MPGEVRQTALERKADYETYGGLASLHTELGETAAAEDLFDKCQSLFRGVSPFRLAQLEFQRGHMRQEHQHLPRAGEWRMAAWQRLPAYTQAEGHLAEVESAMGQHDEAISGLGRLVTTSDDPDYAAQLARILAETGQLEDADLWRAQAKARYNQLIASHPAAFADHAANSGSDWAGTRSERSASRN